MLPTLDLLGDQLVQPPEGALGIPAKALGQVPAVQDVLTEGLGVLEFNALRVSSLVTVRGDTRLTPAGGPRHQEEGGAGDRPARIRRGPSRGPAALPEAFAPRNL